jgi:hypothetical protein
MLEPRPYLNDFGDWIMVRSDVSREHPPNPLTKEPGIQYLREGPRSKNILIDASSPVKMSVDQDL